MCRSHVLTDHKTNAHPDKWATLITVIIRCFVFALHSHFTFGYLVRNDSGVGGPQMVHTSLEYVSTIVTNLRRPVLQSGQY